MLLASTIFSSKSLLRGCFETYIANEVGEHILMCECCERLRSWRKVAYWRETGCFECIGIQGRMPDADQYATDGSEQHVRSHQRCTQDMSSTEHSMRSDAKPTEWSIGYAHICPGITIDFTCLHLII